MSTTMPPGWYPDPGHTGPGSASERWWDGQRWSDHVRGVAPGAVPPSEPPASPPSRGPRGRLVALVAASAAVALLVAAGVLVARHQGGDGERADGPDAGATSPPRRGDPERERSPGEAPSHSPGDEPLALAHGVKLPLLSGWQRTPGTYGAAVTASPYPCPLKEGQCVRAGASVHVTPADGTPRKVAEADVASNAERSYDEDYYGGITSHEQTRAGQVRVAGHDGWYVRWKVDNATDPDAYVQSVAFPHPDGTGQMLVLRMGVDIDDDAPPVSVLDEIVAGVEEGAVLDDTDTEAV